MYTLRYIGALLALLMSCCGCALLDRARNINKQHYLDSSLHQLKAKVAKEYHHPDSLHSLHPTTKQYQSEAQQLLAIALDLQDTSRIISVAQLLGRGDLMLHYSRPHSAAIQAEANLLIGNYGEALRLVTSGATIPPETRAMSHLLSGDTLQARPLLDEVAHRGTAPIRLAALRRLQQLYPSDPSYRRRLYRMTDLPAERLYLKILELNREDAAETILTEKATQLLAVPLASPLWRTMAEQLSPLLAAHDLFVPLYDIQEALTRIDPTPTRYSILLEYPLEINRLRAYERPDRPAQTTPSASSFRQKYGHITRSPNWAMTFSKNSGRQSAPTPSPAVYRHLKQRLRRLLH